MKNLEKSKKMATVIDKIFNVVIWIMMVTNTVVSVLAILSAFLPKVMNGAASFIGFQIGGTRFVVADADTAILYDKLGEKGWVFSIAIILVTTISFSAGITVDVIGGNASMNLGFLFTAAFLLLLSYIFEYGAILQKESDETL